MTTYGQFCPIAKAAELFCERWNALVIRNVAAGAHRFSDIQRGVPHMSSTLLSKRLKVLEAEGILTREKSPSGGYWLYHLTDAGAEFVPMVGALGAWGRRWTRRDLEDGELDLGLLIWGLEHCVAPEVYAPGRVVVHLDFTDVPRHKACYWFVNEDGVLDLCVTDPGFDIDLWLAGTLRDLTHLYRGDVSVAVALDDGRLDATGPTPLRRKLKDWFNFGPLAEIEPMAGAPVGSI
jgi:DNA-binding HxlR family transcriptional regulator